MDHREDALESIARKFLTGNQVDGEVVYSDGDAWFHFDNDEQDFDEGQAVANIMITRDATEVNPKNDNGMDDPLIDRIDGEMRRAFMSVTDATKSVDSIRGPEYNKDPNYPDLYMFTYMISFS